MEEKQCISKLITRIDFHFFLNSSVSGNHASVGLANHIPSPTKPCPAYQRTHLQIHKNKDTQLSPEGVFTIHLGGENRQTKAVKMSRVHLSGHHLRCFSSSRNKDSQWAGEVKESFREKMLWQLGLWRRWQRTGRQRNEETVFGQREKVILRKIDILSASVTPSPLHTLSQKFSFALCFQLTNQSPLHLLTSYWYIDMIEENFFLDQTKCKQVSQLSQKYWRNSAKYKAARVWSIE